MGIVLKVSHLHLQTKCTDKPSLASLRIILLLGRCHRAVESRAHTSDRETTSAKLSQCCVGALPGSQLLMSSPGRANMLCAPSAALRNMCPTGALCFQPTSVTVTQPGVGNSSMNMRKQAVQVASCLSSVFKDF